MKLKNRAKQLKIDIPAVFLALRNKETPAVAKIFAAITIIYVLSPIDFIPDFIPVLGYLDDVILLPCLIALTIRLIPHDIFEECRVNAKGLWTNGKPQRWYFALPFVAIWLLVVSILIKEIWF